MKCIRYKATDKTERLKDNQAHDAVSQGKATYIPKHQYRTNKKGAK